MTDGDSTNAPDPAGSGGGGPSGGRLKLSARMAGITARVVRRPILVLMVYGAITLFGIYALTLLPIDQLPKIEPPVVTIITIYPAAGAEDVEKKVTDHIERAVGTISGLEKLNSVSKENMSVITLHFGFGTDMEEAVNDVRQNLEFVKQELPDDARKPFILKFNTSMFPVFIGAVRATRGDIRSYRREVVENLGERLERLPGVGSVVLMNAPKRQVVVEINRPRLDARKVSLLRLSQVLGRANFSVPAGRMTFSRQDLPVTVPGDFESLEEIRNHPIAFSVVPSFGGAQRMGMQEPLSSELGIVRLKDVARVKWGYPDRQSIAKHDKYDAMWMLVFRKAGANTVEVAERVRKLVRQSGKYLPPELEVQPLLDGSEMIRRVVDNLTDTVILGGILVVVVVLLFLRRLRPSLVVAVTIPASMIGTFLGMYLMGYTINTVSLIGLALAIGMVVDNAIVVLEAITKHVEEGRKPMEAAVTGTREVATAISAATLTTVVIFAPLVFVRGFIGEMFGEFAFVMVLTLVASLVTALIVTPTMTARLLRAAPALAGADNPDSGNPAGDNPGSHNTGEKNEGGSTRPRRFRPLRYLFALSERGFAALERGYGKLLGVALRRRLMVILVALGISGGSVALVMATGIDFVMTDDHGFIQIEVEMPEGTPLKRTAQVAEAVSTELRRQPESLAAFFSAGTTETAMMSSMGGKEGPNVAQIYTRLVNKTKRKRSEEQVADAVKGRMEKKFPKARLTVRTGNPMGQAIMGTEKPITLYVLGKDLDHMRKAARSIRDVVKSIKGTHNVTTELMGTRPEFKVEVNRRRAGGSLLNSFMIGATLRMAVYGHKVGSYRGGKEHVDLFMRLRDQDRDSPEDLEALKVTTGLPSMGQPLLGPDGVTLLIGQGAEKLVRLGTVGRVVEGESPIEIRHRDKQRMVIVASEYRGRALGDIISELDRKLKSLKLPEGVSFAYGAEVERQKETLADLIKVLLLGIVLVYMVMAAQFESLLDPFVIMFSLPFAFTGVFMGFLVTGTKLSLPAFMGLVVLMGIVVNNAIVLIDYVKYLRVEGSAMNDAITAAGRRRLRPVLMTTFTTSFGMLPLALTRTEGAFMWAPLGQAVVGGLLFSTLVTLILVPVVYSLLERFRRKKTVEPAPSTEAA